MILRKPNNINGLPEELGFSAQKRYRAKTTPKRALSISVS